MPRRSSNPTPDFSSKRFGAHLKAIRRALGMSQPALAASSELSTQVISNLERATAFPSIDTVCKLARGLGVDPRELFAAGLVVAGRPSSTASKLSELMQTFDEELAAEAMVVLKALSRMRRRRP
jgi:transcriptional regulator with XRE-family HTH domain